jgi:hypothetical protein
MADQEILGTEVLATEPVLASEQVLQAEVQSSHNLYRKLLATGAAAAMAVAGVAEAKLMGPKAGEAAIKHCSRYVVASIGINNGHER